MQITFSVPEELVSVFGGDPGLVARIALESFAVEGYRSGKLSAFQVRQMLGHESRWQTEDFLAAHGVWPGTTEADLVEEFQSLDRLRPA